MVLPAGAASSSLADAGAKAVRAVDVWHHLGLFSSGLGQALRPLGRWERRGGPSRPSPQTSPAQNGGALAVALLALGLAILAIFI